MCHAKQHAPKGRKGWRLDARETRPTLEDCLALIQHRQHITILYISLVIKTPSTRTAIAKPQMTKSKKPAPKPRQTPYPATPANSNLRSASTARPVPGTVFFPPAPRFNFDSAHTPSTLTPYEDGQTLEEFIRDLRKNDTRIVDESGNVGTPGLRDLARFDEGASENAEGQASGSGREGNSERIDQDGDVDWARGTTERLGLSNHPKSQQESPEPESELAPLDTLAEEEKRLAKLLEPVAEFNARTPWPIPFHEQPVTHPVPAWHAGCPEGYEPTTLAGYPQRRQYPIYNPAAHDADIVRDEYGHWCLDLDEQDKCLFGKCAGCEICRP